MVKAFYVRASGMMRPFAIAKWGVLVIKISRLSPPVDCVFYQVTSTNPSPDGYSIHDIVKGTNFKHEF